MLSQTSAVLAHLKDKGTITQAEAWDLFRASRLSAIIFNLKAHHHIETIMVQSNKENKYGRKPRYAIYYYEGVKNNECQS